MIWIKRINFLSPLPGGCIRNLIETGLVVAEDKSFENVDNGRRILSYKLPESLGSGDLKKRFTFSEAILSYCEYTQTENNIVF